MTRTSNTGADQVQVKLVLSLLPSGSLNTNTLAFGDITVTIPSNITSQHYAQTSYTYTQTDITQTQNLPQIQNYTFIKALSNLTLTVPASSTSNTNNLHVLIVNGKNSIEVPIGT